MKRIFLFTALICIYGVLAFSPVSAALQALQTGMEAPDFTLKTISGDKKSFSDFKGEKAYRSRLLVDMERKIGKDIDEDAATS